MSLAGAPLTGTLQLLRFVFLCRATATANRCVARPLDSLPPSKVARRAYHNQLGTIDQYSAPSPCRSRSSLLAQLCILQLAAPLCLSFCSPENQTLAWILVDTARLDFACACPYPTLVLCHALPNCDRDVSKSFLVEHCYLTRLPFTRSLSSVVNSASSHCQTNSR